MYNSIVLVKQVPDTANISGKVMKDDGTVNRAKLPAIFNHEDKVALELALQIKERYGGKVTVGGDDRDVLLFNVNTSYELSGGELRARRLKIHSSGTGNSIFTQT